MKIEELIVESILGELSLEEEMRVQQWLSESDNHVRDYNKLQLLYSLVLISEGENAQSVSRIKTDLLQSIRQKSRRQLVKRWSVSLAVASAVLFFAVFAYDLTTKDRPSPVYEFVAVDESAMVVDTLIHNNTKAYIKTTEGIIKLSSDKINLTESKSSTASRIVYNTVTVPERSHFHIVLEDSTSVWLNEGSSLTYPVKFSEHEREVLLSGEAYFDVTSNPDRPFVVKAKSVESVVYGTELNVNAYNSSPFVSTTLFTGKVKVNGVNVVPGEMAMKQDNSSKVDVKVVDLRSANSWLRGEFYFDNAPLEDIMIQLSQWYDKEVIFDKEAVKSEMFTLIMKRDKNLTDLLRMLENTEKVKFKIKENTIYVTMK